MLGVDHQHAEAEKVSLEQIRAFLEASEEVQFEGQNREEVYGWVDQVLRQQHYDKQGRRRGDWCAATWRR